MQLVARPPLPSHCPPRKVPALEVEHDDVRHLLRDGRLERLVRWVDVEIVVALLSCSERKNIGMLKKCKGSCE